MSMLTFERNDARTVIVRLVDGSDVCYDRIVLVRSIDYGEGGVLHLTDSSGLVSTHKAKTWKSCGIGDDKANARAAIIEADAMKGA